VKGKEQKISVCVLSRVYILFKLTFWICKTPKWSTREEKGLTSCTKRSYTTNSEGRG